MENAIDDIFGAGHQKFCAALKEIAGTENPRVMLVADFNVVQQNPELGGKIGKCFQAGGIQLCGKPAVLSGGEKIKSDALATVMRAMHAMLDAKIGRDDIVLALGGGALLDVAGYAAKQIRGGVKLVRLPTTVASMIDGAWSDTAAVNTVNVKDALKIPCRPEGVFVDYSFARTVLDGVWRAGFAEAARLAAACDASLMDLLEKHAEDIKNRDYEAMREVVSHCLETRKHGSAKEIGEWSAMRLETMSGYKLPHGYAMTIGLMIDAKYAMIKGYLSEAEEARIAKFLVDCGAADGVAHSGHLLAQPDNVLFGLDAWELSHGKASLNFPASGAKTVVEEKIDREAMRNAINMVKY